MRAVERISVVLFFFLLSISIGKIEADPLHLLLAALLGWLIADLLSGVVHWAFDSFGSVETPVVGPALIRPFRDHHEDPAAMARHDFIEVNGASCMGCLPLLGLAVLVPLPAFAHALLVFACLGVLLTNQCHKWAHTRQRPAAVKWLQRAGLILHPRQHGRHHRPPYDSHYCTASGWLNRPLDALLRRLR